MVTTRLQRVAVFAFFVAAGCKKPSTPISDAAPVSSSVEATNVEATIKDAPPPARDPIVDLLHTVDTTVAVSSKVGNPYDHPEHLVDGKPETAWNGKAGDLRGWIAFRVPKSATVLRVELTPGFDKKATKGDLFTMNHRIKKVRLSREGEVLQEVTLDVGDRSLQAIDVDAPGGDFKIDVLETVPGTQKKWRELTVSELRVWGRAGGAPENPAHIPKMAIGSLDGTPPAKSVAAADLPRGPFATAAELCAAYDRAVTPLIDATFTDDAYPGKLQPPHCSLKDPPEGFSAAGFDSGAFRGAAFATIDGVERRESVLLLASDKGWWRTDVRAWSRHIADPGCLRSSSARFEGVTIARTSAGQEVALVRIVNREVRWGQMDDAMSGADTTESVHACRVDAAGSIACEGPKALATAHEPAPPSWTPADASFLAIDATKIPWRSRKTATIGPTGELRIE